MKKKQNKLLFIAKRYNDHLDLDNDNTIFSIKNENDVKKLKFSIVQNK
jgi:hypothetical protein